MDKAPRGAPKKTGPPIPHCPVCRSKYRAEIEKKMLDMPTKSILRDLANKETKLSQTKILAHMRKCVGDPRSHPDFKVKKSKHSARQSIEALYQSPEVNTQMVLAEQQFRAVNEPMEILKNEASLIRKLSMDRNQLGTALLAIDKEAKLIEIQVKISAEMRAQEMHSEVLQKREWARTQKFIWDFMEDHNLVDEFWDGLATISVAGRR